MDLGGVIPALLLFAFLLLVNAFFVLSEYAIVRVRRTQLAELAEAGSGQARMALRISDDLDQYVSTVQVGVTGASLALGIVGEPTMSALLRPVLGGLEAVAAPLYRTLSFLLSFTLVTYLTLVLAEIAPKYLAIQRTLQLALLAAYPLELVRRLLFPFVWFVDASANRVLALVGIRPTGELDVHSEEELKLLVAASTRKGILQESERLLLANALDFADTLVRQVMVPRTEIAAIEANEPLRELRDLAGRHPFTRYPVYDSDLDHIVGVAHVKDLVPATDLSRPVRDSMRRPLFLPETMRLDQALAEFRRERTQLAVVVDEFGGTAGLVTLEDVIEELVGEVQDEFDRESPQVREEPSGSLLVDGLTPLDDLRERLSMTLAEEPYDTVGGLVFGRLGRLPSVGDWVEVEGYRFQVTGVDGRRVAQVRAQRAPLRRRA